MWLTDFGANAIVRFDPRTERFTTIGLPSSPANVRQLLGRQTPYACGFVIPYGP